MPGGQTGAAANDVLDGETARCAKLWVGSWFKAQNFPQRVWSVLSGFPPSSASDWKSC